MRFFLIFALREDENGMRSLRTFIRIVFAFLLLALVAACHRPLKVVEPAEGPSPELLTIDSLLWQQPDTALACLVSCFDACTTTEYNRHYANLLLSELLYKNDYSQTNRPELQQAVAYYDSLVRKAPPLQRGLGGFPPLKGGKGDSKHKPISNNDHFFLAARAHYINGVGYYENDSVIEACREYLKALEIMEGRFEEKELVGENARFMALTYTLLTGLFSDQYLHEQAIYFGKKSLVYYQKHDAVPWHKAWMLNEIGTHYDMMDSYDSAAIYYHMGLSVLPDTNSLMYRDISALLAFLSYKKDKTLDFSQSQMRILLSQAESEKEYLARCSIIGDIYYHEKQLDSAYVYFNKVFHHSQSVGSRKQAAEWLIDICKTQDRDSEILEYATFLTPFANQNENQSPLKSQLTKMFHDYERERLEIAHRKQFWKLSKYGGAALSAITLVFIVFHFFNKKRHRYLKSQNEEKERQFESIRYEYEIHQKALLGKLKQRNEELRAHKEEIENILKTLEKHQRRADWSSLGGFLEEDICKEIMNALHNKDIKREAKVGDHTEMKLSTTQLSRLDVAVEKHFQGFTKMLTDMYPRISNDEMHQCQLYLLDIEDVQIAHLLFCDYSTVKKRSRKLKTALNTEKKLRQFIKEIVL